MHDVDVSAPPAPVASRGGAATARAHDRDNSMGATRPGRLRFAHLRRATLVVIVLALVTVVTTTVLVRHVVDDGEQRQLHQRTREASVVLQSLVDMFGSPMRTAALVLRATEANAAVFGALAKPVTGKDHTIAGAALLRIDGPGGAAAPVIVAQAGAPLALTATPTARGLGKVNGKLTLVDLLQSKVGHRLGLVLGAPAMPKGYALYAEAQFPIPGVSLRDEEAFSDLRYAVYLGGVQRTSSILFGTADRALSGDSASQRVPVGNSELLLVAAPRRHLSGNLAGVLPWFVLAVGLVGTASGAAALEAIGRRRDSAVAYAGQLAQSSAELIVTQTQLSDLNASLEDAVEERTSELQAANRELESFAYAVSHDLRAPLRAIDGFGLALVEEYGELLDDQGRDYVRRVRSATQRMGELIDDLLVLSRVTRADMTRERVDLSALARSVLARLSESAPERDVETVVASGAATRGDERLLKIALENLLGNAWKFTTTRPAARIEFGMTQHNGGLPVYFVRDNGVGFDPQYANRLFNPFQRLHATGEFEGNGIGLATVARVVERHGGKVWGEGAVGTGATFYFTCGDPRWREL